MVPLRSGTRRSSCEPTSAACRMFEPARRLRGSASACLRSPSPPSSPWSCCGAAAAGCSRSDGRAPRGRPSQASDAFLERFRRSAPVCDIRYNPLQRIWPPCIVSCHCGGGAYRCRRARVARSWIRIPRDTRLTTNAGGPAYELEREPGVEDRWRLPGQGRPRTRGARISSFDPARQLHRSVDCSHL